MIRRINAICVVFAVVGFGLVVAGCSHDDSGPSNEKVVNDLQKAGQINTDPNSKTAVQPRSLTGEPITPGSKAPKMTKPADSTTPGAPAPGAGGG